MHYYCVDPVEVMKKIRQYIDNDENDLSDKKKLIYDLEMIVFGAPAISVSVWNPDEI